ncbi:G patch domain-containing protein 4 [Eumeta japonica]|uniref:G patch domain-containing protein 4 n=1 Tax=Eumeta variegata TaxID=151549 RepID=A0A4C1UTZ9_EUMVA|nr:G patch domain-containing protein 4 [Eumeta japonica]
MDFARKQLEKYGWAEGKGLGKNENGIAKALKPKLKRNVTGVGHDAGADFTDHWWTDLYNKAAINIQVEEKNGKTKKIKTVDPSEFIITNSMWHLKKIKKDGKSNIEEKKYGDYFIKTELLDGGTAKVKKIKKYDSESEDEKKDVYKMTDEELFAACEGRTVHKGARHGLKALGKLARIEQQEKLLLSQPKYEAYSQIKTKKKQLINSPELSYNNNLAENFVKEDLENYENKFSICNNEVENREHVEHNNDSDIEVLENKGESKFKIKKKKKNKLKDNDQVSTEYDATSKHENVKVQKYTKKKHISNNNDRGDSVKYRDCNLEITGNLNTNESKITKLNLDDNTNMLVVNVDDESESVLQQNCNDVRKCKKRKKKKISDIHIQNSDMNNKNIDNELEKTGNFEEVHYNAKEALNDVACIDEGENISSIKKKKKKKSRKA